jgi:hypothetical protein
MTLRAPLALCLLLAGCGGDPSTHPPVPGTAPEAVPAPSLASLDGTAWKIIVEPMEPGEKAFKDILQFSGGRERQLAFESYQKTQGFAPGSFSTPGMGAETAGPLGFEATLNNPAGESLNVSGRATAEAVWGQVRLRKADWTLKTYRFRGVPAKP